MERRQAAGTRKSTFSGTHQHCAYLLVLIVDGTGSMFGHELRWEGVCAAGVYQGGRRTKEAVKLLASQGVGC